MSGTEGDRGGEWTVRRLLEWTTGYFTRKEVDSPRLAAELLLSHVLGAPRIKLYPEYERPVGEKDLATFRGLVQRAGEQEPIAYLTGRAHFFNLEFEVGPGVLIPRPDTETLVENVLQMVRHQSGMEAPRVLDLCTGSGCIAAAIAHHLKSATVVGIDVSAKAVEAARRNVERLGLAGRVVAEQGDLYEPLSRMVDPGPFHIIASNPPYVATGKIEGLDRNVKDYEPLEALDGGLDGLAVHRRIMAGAAERLIPGGRIYLEIAFDQGEPAKDVVGEYDGFEEVKVLKDYGGRDRVVAAKRK